MKFTIPLIFVGFAFGSCQTGNDSTQYDITGTYVREYSFKVIHPGTGDEIGTRTIRDTIFIHTKNKVVYEVSNSKWMLNDYDVAGWRNMEHAEDRPMPRYQARFDPIDSLIRSEFNPPLYLDPSTGRLYQGVKGREYYLKSKEG
jgi:hypothetical protein